jgi:hypothetical protein
MLEAVQRGVQGALVDLKHLLRDLLDPLGDGPTMHGAYLESSQNQEVERPFE